jgi:hypothetical protein
MQGSLGEEKGEHPAFGGDHCRCQRPLRITQPDRCGVDGLDLEGLRETEGEEWVERDVGGAVGRDGSGELRTE